MKRALIVTGGYINFDKVNISPLDYNLIVAADSGYLAAEKLRINPDIIVGDFDSAAKPVADAEIIAVPAEKDDTDTMLACNIAIERNCNNITIVGGTGGRADHFLSNVFSLEAFKNKGIDAILTDGENTIQILKDQTVTIPYSDMYFSLFSLGDCTVSLSGCKFPLTDYLLTRANPSFAVSNEVTDKHATVIIKGSAILCQYNK